MTYDLKKVAVYADKIAKACQGEDVIVSSRNTWGSHFNSIMETEAKWKGLKNKHTLKGCALTLRNATNFLNRNEEPRGEKEKKQREAIINQYLENLKKAYREIFPKGDIKTPLPIVKPTQRSTSYWSFFSKKKETTPIDHGSFQNELKELKKHLRILQEDKRSHTYFFGWLDFSETQKFEVLNQFITDFKAQQSQEELMAFFKEFYNQAEVQTYKGDSRSRLDILNVPQNFTYWIFGFQATTGVLIDKLAEAVGFDKTKADLTSSCCCF
ncbi:MAG: hypothetical protein H0U73_01270 [Tatlockia sp.]|nr:hypothetical protein [Tatlockia sp.]